MDASSREGEVIAGKYELLARVGSGGMGDVYRARHRLMDREVAIKLLRTEWLRDAAVVHRFLREARAASLVRHPHIAFVLDVDREPSGAPFIVQEWLEGSDLATYLRELGTGIPTELALPILVPVVEAIAAAHERGVVHRDLKPENVFLARESGAVVPKVLDFGIAKLIERDVRLTATNTVIGTPAYMSPEQISEPDRVGPASDVWSLGVLFFETLTGQAPFHGTGVHDLLMKIGTASHPPVRTLARDVPAALERVVDRALQKDPTRRYPTASQMLAHLSALDDAEPDPQDVARAEREALSTQPPPRRRIQSSEALAPTLEARDGIAPPRSEAPTPREKPQRSDEAARTLVRSPVPPKKKNKHKIDRISVAPFHEPQPSTSAVSRMRPQRPAVGEEAPAGPALSGADWRDLLASAGLIALAGVAAMGMDAHAIAAQLAIAGSHWPGYASSTALAIASFVVIGHGLRRVPPPRGAIVAGIGFAAIAILMAASTLAASGWHAFAIAQLASWGQRAGSWIAAIVPAGFAIAAAERARAEHVRDASGPALVYLVLALCGAAAAFALGRLASSAASALFA